MPVVAVINRKGGSGKSTLATHLAACCAAGGLRVMLGDVDKQQSSLGWLRRRAAEPSAQGAVIAGWAADARSVLRPPGGVTHVVLDTPGALRGFDLARVAMQADAILVPTCASAFDREAAADCCAELMALPRVASGRCRVGVVGMRLDLHRKLSLSPLRRGLKYCQTHPVPAHMFVRWTEYNDPAAIARSDIGAFLDWKASAPLPRLDTGETHAA